MEQVGTGFAGIDEALGGLISGDNVAWLCDDGGAGVSGQPVATANGQSRDFTETSAIRTHPVHHAGRPSSGERTA